MDIAMPKLEWDESFSTGVPAMDEDDKRIFAYINELGDLMMGKADRNKFTKTVFSLLNFTLRHMVAEEAMLIKSGYPMMDEHAEDHKRYLNEAKNLYVKYLAGDSDSRILSAELIGVFTELLQEHIVKVDKPCGEFLARHYPEIMPHGGEGEPSWG
jgi:hemerythrin-like metal-binding protein